MDLNSVSEELYAAAPEDFMSLRSERVAAAKKASDRALAKEIGQLRKPTRSAWLVNLLAREAPEELQGLLDLGTALREAQQNMSGPDLRRLSAERHRVVEALARHAAELAADRGHAATEATRQEVVQTLQAALADHSAADVVRAGRVVQSISYGGFGTIDLGPVPTLQRTAERSAEPAPEPEPAGAVDAAEDAAEAQLDRRRREAVQALAAAQDLLSHAEVDREARAAEAERASAAATAAGELVARLRAELAEAEERQRAAAEHAKDAQQVLSAAEGRVRAARTVLEQAAAVLDDARLNA